MARRMQVDGKRAPVELRVDGAPLRAYEGDTVAAALVAHQLPTMRSLKYHRPRAPFCMDGHCGSCLMRIDGEPNMRTCMTPVRDGMEICSQNALPTASHDALGAIDHIFSDGLDHHAIMTGSRLQNRVAQVVVRRLSGQGALPTRAHAAESTLPVERVTCDVLVVGAGDAGRSAAAAATAAGAVVVLLDEQVVADLGANDLREERCATYDLRETALIGAFREDGASYAIACAPTQTYRIEPRAWVWATGSYAQNAVFANNDLPGVFAARAVAPLLAADVLVGERVLIAYDVASQHQADDLAQALRHAGAQTTRIEVATLVAAHGQAWVQGATVMTANGALRVDCDAICIAVVGSPAFEGPKQQGCQTELCAKAGGFVVAVDEQRATSVAGVFACGTLTGDLDQETVRAHAARAGQQAAAFAASIAR